MRGLELDPDRAPGYSPRQWELLEAYVRELGDLLGLQHWVLILHRSGLKNEGASAECWVPENIHQLHLAVAPDFATGKPGIDRREILVHELLHAHLERPWEYALWAGDGMLGHPAAQMFQPGVRGPHGAGH